MRLQVFTTIFCAAFIVAACKPDTSDSAVQPQTEAEKQAYAVGLAIGQKVKGVSDEVLEMQPDFDLGFYLQGIQDTMNDSAQMSIDDAKAIHNAYQAELRDLRMEKQKALREANLAEANAFLEQNKAKEGIVSTESGLQYRVITEGTGAKPGRTDKVSVKYTGRLVDGSVFDTTGDGEARQFSVNRVVKGWTEALQLMSEGSKYELFIPPALGYGSQDRKKIPPNSVLVFEVELVKVITRKAPDAAKAK